MFPICGLCEVSDLHLGIPRLNHQGVRSRDDRHRARLHIHLGGHLPPDARGGIGPTKREQRRRHENRMPIGRPDLRRFALGEPRRFHEHSDLAAYKVDDDRLQVIANAFIPPPAGTYGDAGRNVLTGPGLASLDLSLAKNIAISDKVRAQFRSEFFNVFNRANFATPNAVVFAGTTGISSSAGLITITATKSRQVQFGMKLIF